MKAFRCRACGSLSYPRHRLCRTCRGGAFEEAELGEGTVLTHTELHVPPPGAPPPLRLAIVAFPDGVRALGPLTESVEVGGRVTAEWAVLRGGEGGDREGWRFRPVEDEGETRKG